VFQLARLAKWMRHVNAKWIATKQRLHIEDGNRIRDGYLVIQSHSYMVS
jgi:hypothetical protein